MQTDNDMKEMLRTLYSDLPSGLWVCNVDNVYKGSGGSNYQSVGTYSNWGKYMPELYDTTLDASRKAAARYGTKTRYPTHVAFEPRLSGTQIGAFQSDDPYQGIMVAYNPDITLSKDKQFPKLIAAHEGYHLSQPGKKNLSKIYADVNGYSFPLGLALLEGGVEHAVESDFGKAPSQAYRHYKDLAVAFDSKMPLKDIYNTAENDPRKLIDSLSTTLQSDKQLTQELYKAASVDRLLSLNNISRN